MFNLSNFRFCKNRIECNQNHIQSGDGWIDIVDGEWGSWWMCAAQCSVVELNMSNVKFSHQTRTNRFECNHNLQNKWFLKYKFHVEYALHNLQTTNTHLNHLRISMWMHFYWYWCCAASSADAIAARVSNEILQNIFPFNVRSAYPINIGTMSVVIWWGLQALRPAHCAGNTIHWIITREGERGRKRESKE